MWKFTGHRDVAILLAVASGGLYLKILEHSLIFFEKCINLQKSAQNAKQIAISILPLFALFLMSNTHRSLSSKLASLKQSSRY